MQNWHIFWHIQINRIFHFSCTDNYRTSLTFIRKTLNLIFIGYFPVIYWFRAHVWNSLTLVCRVAWNKGLLGSVKNQLHQVPDFRCIRVKYDVTRNGCIPLTMYSSVICIKYVICGLTDHWSNTKHAYFITKFWPYMRFVIDQYFYVI